VGATIVKKEYDALCDSGRDVLISTCCHSINLLIEKHYPDAAKYLAPVLSPMLAHAKDIKERHPNAKVDLLGALHQQEERNRDVSGSHRLRFDFP
jgi:iron only hydrogenase large subunit-like protein